MQLKNHLKMSVKEHDSSYKIALASAALLGATMPRAQAEVLGWDASASFLGYSEQNRVSAGEFIGTASKKYHQTALFDIKVVADVLTGASANGAVAQKFVQTFTSPSGKDFYTSNANQTPLDKTFQDLRGALSLNWSDAITDVSNYRIGGNVSLEHDYSALSINGEYSHDFFQKNTTFSLGVSVGTNQVKPEGGLPIAFSSMFIDGINRGEDGNLPQGFRDTRNGNSDNVTDAEILLGYTQIINRRMLVQFNYGHSESNGYLTDPYKILSVLDNNGVAQDYLYENRPDSRTKDSFYVMTKYHLEQSIVDFSYRYMTDSWNIKSSTFDVHWHFLTGNNSFWEPHIRYYTQSAADFFTPYLDQSVHTPEFASADYRLGNLDTFTVGLKYGFTLNQQHRAEIRLEYYKQQSKNQSLIDSRVATSHSSGLSGLNLFPDVSAVVLQFSYYF